MIAADDCLAAPPHFTGHRAARLELACVEVISEETSAILRLAGAAHSKRDMLD